MKYEFTEEMGEISGFGGSYEQGCRNMLNAALVWFDDNPNAKPEFTGYKNIYGIINENNEDAQALSDVVGNTEPDCTGAMHQAVISRVLWIKENGWDAYVKRMSEEK